MFRKGQKVRCLSNPYGSFMAVPKTGDIGTVLKDGTHIISVQFGTTKFKAWLVKDGDGNITLEQIGER